MERSFYSGVVAGQCCYFYGFMHCSTAVQKLEELEKEEELREKAGMYESDMSDDDEEMKEKRELARQ